VFDGVRLPSGPGAAGAQNAIDLRPNCTLNWFPAPPPMIIKFSCECGQRVSATPDLIGTEAICPGCDAALLVPIASEDVAVAPLLPEESSHPAPHLIIAHLSPSEPERGKMGLILGLIAVVLVALGVVLWVYSRA
jgi:hypothetical protein